jgi:hypothetical protein
MIIFVKKKKKILIFNLKNVAHVCTPSLSNAHQLRVNLTPPVYLHELLVIHTYTHQY